MYGKVRSDFVLYMVTIFESPAYAYYVQDVIKLLVILHKTDLEEAKRSWRPSVYDDVSRHCDYILAKMHFDKREFFKQPPYWLKGLAEHYDGGSKGNPKVKLRMIAEIKPEIQGLLRKYGPDGRETLSLPIPSKDSSGEL